MSSKLHFFPDFRAQCKTRQFSPNSSGNQGKKGQLAYILHSVTVAAQDNLGPKDVRSTSPAELSQRVTHDHMQKIHHFVVQKAYRRRQPAFTFDRESQNQHEIK